MMPTTATPPAFVSNFATSTTGYTTPTPITASPTSTVPTSDNIGVLALPKRPRTAYNFFFQEQRQRLLQELPEDAANRCRFNNSSGRNKNNNKKKRKHNSGHGKITFSNLGKTVGAAWKAIDAVSLAYYADLASRDKMRYYQEKRAYEQQQQQVQTEQQQLSHSTTNAVTEHHLQASAQTSLPLQESTLPGTVPSTGISSRRSSLTINMISGTRMTISSNYPSWFLEPNDCSDLYASSSSSSFSFLDSIPCVVSPTQLQQEQEQQEQALPQSLLTLQSMDQQQVFMDWQ